jgi:glycosyltransferase involved in cell wall biosynthesis
MGEEMSEMLVPVGDPEALAVALERLLADPDLRRIIGKQGRSQVESRFSIDGMLDGVDRLYTELLERKGRL